MNASLKALALVAVTATATTAVLLPTAAQSQSTATPTTTAPLPQLVQNLPDFTGLVQQVGPGVVNVVAKVSRKVDTGGMPDDMPEIFRRFFGPGMPFPGGPGGPQPRAEEGTSIGSGFIISPDGYVLTNNHVVDGATTVRVKLSDRREFTAKVVGRDKQSDVALLKIDAGNLPALRMGDSNQLKPGQWVVAIGSPFGLDHSVTAGIVSAVGRNTQLTGQQYVPFIQTDVAINQGNSGGPLLDTRGQVVGINSQIFSNSGGYMGVSFAIPIDVAMSAVKQLKATGKVQYGMIGVGLQPLTPELAKANNVPDSNGALIRDVTAGGPGEKAGLQPGDVIRSVNGTQIYQMTDLPPIIGAMAPGTRVTLGIYRGGKPRDVQVTLAPLDQRLLAGNDGDDGDDDSQAPAPAAKSGNALGIVGQELDADDRRQAGLKPGEGVGVAAVRGVAARSSGLQPGDVILQVGQTKVGSVAALDRELARVGAGQSAMLLVNRNGNSQFIAISPHGGDDADDDSDDDDQ